jgi:hypothetical protein
MGERGAQAPVTREEASAQDAFLHTNLITGEVLHRRLLLLAAGLALCATAWTVVLWACVSTRAPPPFT